MNFKLVIKLVSILMCIISGFMLVPAMISIYNNEIRATHAFSLTIPSAVLISLLILFFLRNTKSRTMKTRDGFLFVSLSWICASLIGAFPFYLSGAIPGFTEAFFETISGFTI